jgi:hypothetical protein
MSQTNPWEIVAFSKEEMHEHKENRTYISTGLKELDKLCPYGGLEGGSTVAINADPGAGKTTFALNICQHTRVSKLAISYFVNWEMGSQLKSYCERLGTMPSFVGEPDKDCDSVLDEYIDHLNKAKQHDVPLVTVVDSMSKLGHWQYQKKILLPMINLTAEYQSILIVLNHLKDGHNKGCGASDIFKQCTEIWHIYKQSVFNRVGAKIVKNCGENTTSIRQLQIVKSRNRLPDGTIIHNIPETF